MKNKPDWVKRGAEFSKNLFLELQAEVVEANLLMVASSLAYTTLLSIVPLLAVSFAIFQAFGGMQKLYGVIEPLILSNLAQGTSEEVIALIHKFIDNTHAGAVGVGGLVGLIFTSMSMLSSVERAINHIWKVKVKRSLFQRVSSYWLFITLGPLAISVAVGAATSMSFPIANLFPSGTGLYLISIGLFFCMYKWIPHTPVDSLCSLIASILSAAFWTLARSGYTFYTKHAVTYNAVYGSLGAIPILMIWIYIIWIIILGGAALTAALQKHIKLLLLR